MDTNKSVIVIGLVPELVDFTPFPGVTAEKVRAGISAEVAKLVTLGYAAESIFVDFGETAEAVLAGILAERSFACVCIGAGVRTAPPHFLLFERLINLVHVKAPQAKICFNTSPTDTADAVQRWI